MSDAERDDQLAALQAQVAALTKRLDATDTTASMAASALDGLESDLAQLASASSAAATEGVEDAPPEPSPVEVSPGDDEADDEDVDVDGTTDIRTPLTLTQVHEWVQRHVLLKQPKRRASGAASNQGLCWCSQWWLHPEAVVRLKAMAEAWRGVEDDIAKNGPGNTEALYYRDIFDPLWRELTHPEGPFHRCDTTGHAAPTFLQQDPLPPEDTAESVAED